MKTFSSANEFEAWLSGCEGAPFSYVPQRRFHGCHGEFVGDEFSLDGASISDAIFFTDCPMEASWYSTGGCGEYSGIGEKVIPVYLRLRNPYVIDLKGALDYDNYRIPDAVSYAQKTGHDGVIVLNAFNGNTETGEEGYSNENQYVVFSPNQITSAIHVASLYAAEQVAPERARKQSRKPRL